MDTKEPNVYLNRKNLIYANPADAILVGTNLTDTKIKKTNLVNIRWNDVDLNDVSLS
ncbi:pentapeptide repeat-containing protein [Acaryochloris thomasi]|uniref:pentapeptide repeat-containing protein n=1 Tax=Acaryochloris thomasi TaxID=2929456 RepID=UPI00356B70B6